MSEQNPLEGLAIPLFKSSSAQQICSAAATTLCAALLYSLPAFN